MTELEANLDHQSLTTVQQLASRLFLVKENVYKLSLFSNHFGDAGAKLIASFLSTRKNLWHLNLSYNGIGIEGVRALVEVLTTHKSCEVLDLDENQICEAGVILVLQMVQSNRNLVLVSLNGNPGYEETHQVTLTKYLNQNRKHQQNQQILTRNFFDVSRKLILLDLPTEIKIHLLQFLAPDLAIDQYHLLCRLLLGKDTIGTLIFETTFNLKSFLRYYNCRIKERFDPMLMMLNRNDQPNFKFNDFNFKINPNLKESFKSVFGWFDTFYNGSSDLLWIAYCLTVTDSPMIDPTDNLYELGLD
ncbi:hypothetical protein HDV02_000028 [Globomyces sp. JEL0801]|nr:hypothetical protein HDV02_000028 [Globomyces sp. JEL0801]